MLAWCCFWFWVWCEFVLFWFDLMGVALAWFGVDGYSSRLSWLCSIWLYVGFVWCGYALDLIWSDVGFDVEFGLFLFGFDVIRFNFCLIRCWWWFDVVLLLTWFDLIWFEVTLLSILTWCGLTWFEFVRFVLVFYVDLFWFDFGCWFRFWFDVVLS